ncbi:Lrp/AsnC family transcriptional regulator [Candidatus Micrarchaeota archaeon]|nr:Lrp/AsnC family transcriptional regulator [Candidatus Micrarchaeota archaeon]MBU1681687.1 Lrp/AsnC family transcriptional regulator [Candidatus Micrarchaeota archaeon]
MEEKIDEKDLAILEILEKHGDYTVRQIAKKTLLAPTTIHARIKKLKRNGVIRKYTIDIDRKKIGKKLGAYILILADLRSLKEKHKSQVDLAKDIEKIPSVENVDIVTGGSDLVAKIFVHDIEELDKVLLERIQLLEGVSKTQTMIIIH